MFDALNHEINLTTTSTNSAGTNGKGTPMPANYQLCDIHLPAGENYSNGSRYEPRTNESYSWQYNSNAVHFISRVNGDGSCQIVYYGCLDLDPSPEHQITNWRSGMNIEKVCPNRDGKYLWWMDGTDFGIGYIDVEASIATNNFTTPFFERCAPDPCDFVKLCVPEICGCIQGDFIPLAIADQGLSNNMLDKGFKFMIKHVYYDGRASEWSDWSTLYYQQTETCFFQGIGLSRCMKLRIPVGGPMVSQILFAYSDDGGLTWYLADTIEKYKKYNDSQEKWYERELAELDNFSESDCAFDYTFCNDKERVQIAASDYSRVRNPIPRSPQGAINIGDDVNAGNGIGVYNYIDGVCPVDEAQLQKMNIAVDCSTEQTDCSSEFAQITVRLIIESGDPHGGGGVNRSVYRNGGTSYNAPDDPSDPAYFGGFGQGPAFNQVFSGKVRNFIVYIEGTAYWAEMTQWQANKGFQNPKLVGPVADVSTSTTVTKIATFIQNGGFFYQEATIKVLKGTRGFLRIVDPTQETGQGDAQNTSAPIVGILSSMSVYTSTGNPLSNVDITRKEIYFDTCNGNVVLNEVFLLSDFASTAAAYIGYLKDNNGLPVEGLRLQGQDSPVQAITDHNGFYFFTNSSASLSVNILGELDCSIFRTIQTMSLAGNLAAVTTHSENITDPTYTAYYYLQVQQKLVDCDGNPLSGITISMAGSKSRITDSNGIANLVMRNYSTRNRIVHTVVVNNNGCFSIDCNGNCSPCMPSNIANAPSCFFGSPYFAISNMVVNRNSLISISNGLKSGGHYPFAALFQGNCGLESAAYLLQYLDIPRTQDKNKLGFCKYTLSLSGAVFPAEFSCLKILRGPNENPFLLQWIVDKIIHNGDGTINLTIQSLNDYNLKYFNEANTIYQWAKGDRIEFIRNGDGSILTSAANGLLNYLTISPFNDTLLSGITDSATYFNQLVIEDDNRLGAITPGAIIELQRPKQTIGETIFREICVTIPLENGIPMVDTVSFTTFDTYIINRTSGSFLGYFESLYPSDFWGKTTDGVGLDDTGKSHIKNPYETQRRYGRNISLNSPTQFNYFGDIVKTIGTTDIGDITAMGIYDGQTIIGIGEHNNFMARASDTLLRVNADGSVAALPANSIIGSPEPKASGRYGCQYDSIGSVYFGDGFVRWVDKNQAADVKHDFQQAREISFGIAQTFFRKKCQEMSSINAHFNSTPLNKLRFITGFNMSTGALLLTIKSFRQPGVSNSLDAYSDQNVTLLYHPKADIYLTRAAYTPESYSNVNLQDDGGCAFICYLNGVPFVHPKISDVFNEFFGVSTDWVVGVTMNQYPEKIKVPLAFEVQSYTKWFVSQVTTESANFISQIPAVRVKPDKNGEKWNAAFLKNANSRGGIYGGQVASSYFVKVLFIRDNTVNDLYDSVNIEKRLAYSELGNIFFKFQISEQSGFSENV